MTRAMICGVMLTLAGIHTLAAQRHVVRRYDATSQAAVQGVQRMTWRRAAPHYGKWLTAAASVALIFFAQHEHDRSNRDWNALLDICRSAQDACARGSDGRYIRSDAEQLYQRSRDFDRRANWWLLGAQASLLTTTALFIIDLHPGDGPDNIPYPPVNVGMRIPL